MSTHPFDHGHTVAGWTGFGIATVGSTVLGVGVILVSAPLLVLGTGINLVSLLVTWALHLAGWGKPTGSRPREQWPMGVRDPEAAAGHPKCVGCLLAGRRGGRRTEAGAEAGAEAEASAVVAASGATARSGG